MPNYYNSSDQFEADQPHTYLEEKYVQEAVAEARIKPKFMHKQVRGFAEGKGPRCFHEPQNYNQRFSQYIEDSLYECEDRPTNFPLFVESYFQENLLRRFNMIKYLKAEIRREKMKNEVKRRLL